MVVDFIVAFGAYLWDYFFTLIMFLLFTQKIDLKNIGLATVSSAILAGITNFIGLEIMGLIVLFGSVVLASKKTVVAPKAKIYLLIASILTIFLTDLGGVLVLTFRTLFSFLDLSTLVGAFLMSLVLNIGVCLLIVRYRDLLTDFFAEPSFYRIAYRVILFIFWCLCLLHIVTDSLQITLQISFWLIVITIGIGSLAGYSYYVTIIKLKNEMLLEQQSKQEKLFKNYLSEISSAYQEMADFRHDYRNLLLTLKLKIEATGDKELNEYFKNVVAYSENELGNVFEHRLLAPVARIKNTALRSVIVAKLVKASKQQIAVDLDVLADVELSSKLELVIARIISILLDNAIEASATEKVPKIAVGFEAYGESSVDIIVTNRATTENMQINKWFSPGYTTKTNGHKHGRGLVIVRELVSNNEALSLRASCENEKVKFVLGVS